MKKITLEYNRRKLRQLKSENKHENIKASISMNLNNEKNYFNLSVNAEKVRLTMTHDAHR